MSDLIKRKLEFQHSFVRLQAIEQLLLSAKQKLESKQKQNEELEFLWKNCCYSDEPDVGYASAYAIINLGSQGLLDSNKVISTAVNFASHSTFINRLLLIISHMLKLYVLKYVQTSDGASQHCCPYNFRAPPHPFISIISSNPNSWGAVMLQIEDLLQVEVNDNMDVRNGLFTMLKPIILYIFLNPSTTAKEDICRCRLFKCLFENIVSVRDNDEKNSYAEMTGSLLEYHEPTPSTIFLYEEAMKIKGNYLMLLFKVLHFGIIETDICNKTLALQMLKRMIQKSKLGTSDCELILVAVTRYLNVIPTGAIPDMLYVIEALLSLSDDISSIVLEMLKVAMLQLQLLCGLKSTEPKIKNLLGKMLASLEILQQNDHTKVHHHFEQCFVLSTFFNEVIFFRSSLLRIFSESHHWLNSITKAVARNAVDERDISILTHLLLALLLHRRRLDSANEEPSNIFLATLKCLMDISEANPHISYSILPVFIYLLKDSGSKLIQEVFFALPSLASHPYCVSPILKILKSMSSDISLKPMALRLCIDVWRKQDRCYPHLQAMISGDMNSAWKKDKNLDFTIVKSLAICVICKERPHQYGGDMLKLVSQNIRAFGTSECDVAKVSFALEALYLLCQNKALNLQTVWEEFGSVLQNQTSSHICAGILKLLSLVPSFYTNSEQYGIFFDRSLSWIWNKLNSTDDTLVIDAALQSLSNFDFLRFKVRHLPPSFRPKIQEDVAEDEYLEMAVQSSFYGNFMLVLKDENLEAFENFSSSAMHQELESLPRDIHYRALKSQLQATQPKPLKVIPEFIMNFYEKNKQPAMKASSASSLLLCYSAIPELDSFGNPLLKSLVSHGRKVVDILQSLLKEVSIEPNNWQSVLWCAHGWRVFIRKCFKIIVDGRRAELNMQKTRGDFDADNTDEFEQKINTIHSWCRDKITNILKGASRGNPSMQGNAVLALGGLIIVTNEGENVNDGSVSDADKLDTEYLKMPHWTTMAIDTIMSVANEKHISSGRIMSWCQYRAVSSTGKLSTTQLGKICAIQALAFITSTTMRRHSGKVLEMLAFLRKNDLGEEGFIFHCSLALGHILSIIYRENLSDRFTKDGVIFVKECLNTLYRNVSTVLKDPNKQLENDLGSLFGFGLAFSSKLQCSDPTFNASGKKLILELKELFVTENHSPECMQVLTTVLTWTYLSGFSSHVFEYDEVKNLVDIFNNAVAENPSMSGVSESLGALCNGIFLCGDSAIGNEINSLFERWYKIINRDRIPTREKLAALSGIGALVGANSTLSPLAVDPSMLGSSQYLSKLSATVKSFRMLSRNSDDPGVPSKSIILLGHLYMSLESNSSAIGSTLPSSYDYLPKTSIIRCFYNICKEGVKLPELTKSTIMDATMRIISKSALDFNLPPVNWTSVFSPILLGSFSEETKNCVVSVLLSQCGHSTACSSLLSIWISPKKFDLLPCPAQAQIYQNLEKVIKCQEDLKIADFLDALGSRCISMSWDTEKLQPLCDAIMDGLIKSLKQSSSLVPAVKDMLNNMVERLFTNLPLSCYIKNQINVMTKLSECMEFLPDANALLAKFEKPDAQPRNILKCLFVRCCCTLNGSHSLSMCNNTILVCGKDESISQEALWIVTECLSGVENKVQVNQRIEWLQDLMGAIKNTMESEEHNGALIYLINIFAVAVAIWSTAGGMLPVCGYYCDNFMSENVVKQCLSDCKLIFPTSITRLFQSATWEGIIKHLTDWLIFMLRNRTDDDLNGWIQAFRGALYSARKTKGYQLPSVWCKVVTAVCQT